MDRRSTLILVTVFLILAGYTYWTQFRPGASSEATPTPSATLAPVFDLLTDKVARFQLRDVQKDQLVLVTRQGETWHMEQPKDSATDPNRVNSALSTVAHLTASRVLTNVTDLAAFGLITGTLEARMTLSDTTEYVLKVGDQTPDKSAYYAQKGGDPQVYLIESSTVDDLKDLVANPPYPPTITPTPPPTLTPSMTPTATTTPPTAVPTGAETVPTGAVTPGSSPSPPPSSTPGATSAATSSP